MVGGGGTIKNGGGDGGGGQFDSETAANSSDSECGFGEFCAVSADWSADPTAILVRGLPPPRLPKSSFMLQATSRNVENVRKIAVVTT